MPPAYDDVWITPLPTGHLQATGRDARKRKQYRYHPDWSAEKSRLKFDRLAEFGEALPSLRRKISAGLEAPAGDVELAVAATLALIDRGSLRVGHPSNTRENGTYGATTLRNDHITFEGGVIELSYLAKGHTDVKKRLHGKALERALEKVHDLPGCELISWIDDQGTPHAVRSEQLNGLIEEVCGSGMTAKTFRTWNGTHEAFRTALVQEELTIKSMSEAAADRLHNTPTIARNSYIHPAVVDLTELPTDERKTLLADIDPAPGGDWRAGEAELLSFLKQKTS
ncbi:DNA topoisomerase [Litoreibacter roseus]|uniref:DNA topoisomerase n=1 Tax=Litoreibacter roseus TaxID=2601869 RepID=A0A6N6JJ61_9RHOB|nr:DNA topoisomerase IB [Litoreibacter roseus]GFE66105.1 DNA topoisomerase [Litoreibacter roseus]